MAQFQFQKYVGGDSTDEFADVLVTSDGGFAVAGETSSAGSGDDDVLLQKYDSSGTLQWSFVYGDSAQEQFWSMVQASDGGFVLVGSSKSYLTGTDVIIMLKTNSSGVLQWENMFGNGNSERAFDIDNDSDGGYVLVGYGRSWGAGDKDIYVIKTDSAGDLVWQKNLGGVNSDRPISVKAYSAGGYIISGYTRSYGNARKAFVSRLDASGTPMWTQTLGGLGVDDAGNEIIETANGNILTGGTYGSDSTTNHGLLWKLDANGNTIWAKRYSGPGEVNFDDLTENSDGSFMVSGFYQTAGGDADAIMINLDTAGTEIWAKVYGDTSGQIFHAHAQTSNGSWAAVGAGTTPNNPEGQGYMVKTNAAGESGCDEGAVQLTATAINPDSAITFGIDTNGMEQSYTVSTSSASLLDSNHCHGQIVSITKTLAQDLAVVFPNPVSGDQFKLRIPDSWNGETRVRILNPLGMVIKDVVLRSGEHRISQQFHSAGIYLISVHPKDGVPQSIRILNVQ